MKFLDQHITILVILEKLYYIMFGTTDDLCGPGNNMTKNLTKYKRSTLDGYPYW